MKDWVQKKIKEHRSNNVIFFPLREEDVERKLRNAKIDKELEKDNEAITDKEK